MNTVQVSNKKVNRVEFNAKMFLAVLVAYVFIIVDVLNMEAYSSEMSRDISTQVFSYYYPREPDDIVVVNTDRDSVEFWPPSYRDYAQWLEYLIDYQPKAIVLDINFELRKNATYKDELIDVLEYAKEMGVSLYGIHAPESDEDLVQYWEPIGTRWDGLELGYYPVRSVDGKLMAATRIYRDFYQQEDEHIDTPMFIKWPSRPPKEQLGFIKKLFYGVGCWLKSCQQEGDATPYLDKFKVHEMFVTDEEAVKKFTDRIVFFGSELPASKDFFSNPIYGQVPGVFLHAMALDNLIKYGDGYYKRDDSKPVLWGLGLGGWIEVIVLLFIFSMFLLKERVFDEAEISKKKKLWKAWKTAGCYMWICLGITVAAVLISHLGFNRDPGNVVGLMAANPFIYEFVYFSILLVIGFLIRTYKPNFNRKKVKKK